MSVLPLPQPDAPARERFELAVITRLDRMAMMLAEIHQLVSPREKEDGPTLVSVLQQLVEQVGGQSLELARLAEAVDRLGTGRPAQGAMP
ncbi:hypothetical protein [Acidomonas methanolica]|uniref:Uncharacterized protein n=1 Tax=Acidomonas methanolica NBRC 104435 TaxID=1231351 RepID=A0A023D7Q8_ACIMT|nr:hypothetical protein [Acidomonas methanolica]MBU2655330.1 hypothetical protein [Acidomonas methanolica]TCS24083.1 hypothetical protein EDC31_1253 [Acidomonas methanolica]GAJ29765.1 hypothetical protein Amme_076_058 [Acidomonas methanolica NBRC 104435]GBQ55211.1 hypothetical protein AA0498_2225 [Acidomonas methanolica]GEK99997.1 hypothetical protein AME01nite_24960 [Acidomonas methanolica NBRC 104435]